MEGALFLAIFWAAMYVKLKLLDLDEKYEKFLLIMAQNQQKILDTIIEIERNRNHD